MKTCKHCGREFVPKNPKGKFCSDKCRVYAGRQKAKVTDLTQPTNVVKPAERPKTNYTVNTGVEKPEVDRDAIIAQIKAIEAEKIPAERNTSLGRPSWKLDQQKRINDLKKQLQ